jgi:hypothetical protein
MLRGMLAMTLSRARFKCRLHDGPGPVVATYPEIQLCSPGSSNANNGGCESGLWRHAGHL